MKKVERYQPDEMEPEILKLWQENKVYSKAKNKNQGKKSFYFLDGPPYTSGSVHIGTAWNKVLKDAFLRYQRMAGLDVWDRAGYDMHGLPTEHATEKKLGLKGKPDIPKFGIAKFTAECKKLALENLEKMNQDFARLGVWMDFENPYQTVTNSFMEGEWWLVKKAHENNRLYEGLKAMPWCPHCGTALAKHELEYKNIKDDSIFLKFPIIGKDNEFLIVWTTTPWTIPFNLAVMANPKLDYVRAKVDGEIWIMAQALSGALVQGVANKKMKVLETFKGKKLKGLKYRHPCEKEIKQLEEFRKSSDKVHSVVLSEEYVDTSAGSGLVHTAPGCGPEDFEVGHREGIPAFNNLDQNGVFPDNMGRFSGFVAKKDDSKITDFLDKEGALIATTRVEHDYAHCWRCKNPVIFKTTKQWFFKIEDLRENMKELNKDIKWVPDWAGHRQFDDWLSNLRDNGITRQRYWGTPLPIWRCQKCNEYVVVGSIKELKKLAGKVPQDLHLPHIDKVTFKCKCGGVMKRLPDILDVWIDAGTTSWTCLDYPQRKDLFQKLWPADFILEGKDQIRGWFNLLYVASMISMQKPSFKGVYMHGFVQDAQGRKMSKSLGNYVLPQEVVKEFGADTFRYYMTGGATPGVDINYNLGDVKIKRRNLTVLWNLHKFLIDYSHTISKNPARVKPVQLDTEEKYIISRLNSTIKEATELYESYRIDEVPEKLEEMFLELSRSYIKFVRDKAATGSGKEKQTVLAVVFRCLLEILKMFGTIAPFICEKIYQNLKQEFNLKQESIHLFDWPQPDQKKINHGLEQQMETVKGIITGILNTREKAGLGVRWPVRNVYLITDQTGTKKTVKEMSKLINQQANVKNVVVKQHMEGVQTTVQPNYQTLKPSFGDKSPRIIAKMASLSGDSVMRHLQKQGQYLVNVDGEKVPLTRKHFIIKREVPDRLVEGQFPGGWLYLDHQLDEELLAEGFAREITRRVQKLRKKAGLKKPDQISLYIKAEDKLVKGIGKHRESIQEKVGAAELEISPDKPTQEYEHSSQHKIKQKQIEIQFNVL